MSSGYCWDPRLFPLHEDVYTAAPIRATSDRIVDNERRIERQRQLIADLTREGDNTANPLDASYFDRCHHARGLFLQIEL
jgi:hypothetical protein